MDYAFKDEKFPDELFDAKKPQKSVRILALETQNAKFSHFNNLGDKIEVDILVVQSFGKIDKTETPLTVIADNFWPSKNVEALASSPYHVQQCWPKVVPHNHSICSLFPISAFSTIVEDKDCAVIALINPTSSTLSPAPKEPFVLVNAGPNIDVDVLKDNLEKFLETNPTVSRIVLFANFESKSKFSLEKFEGVKVHEVPSLHALFSPTRLREAEEKIDAKLRTGHALQVPHAAVYPNPNGTRLTVADLTFVGASGSWQFLPFLIVGVVFVVVCLVIGYFIGKSQSADSDEGDEEQEPDGEAAPAKSKKDTSKPSSSQ